MLESRAARVVRVTQIKAIHREHLAMTTAMQGPCGQQSTATAKFFARESSPFGPFGGSNNPMDISDDDLPF